MSFEYPIVKWVFLILSEKASENYQSGFNSQAVLTTFDFLSKITLVNVLTFSFFVIRSFLITQSKMGTFDVVRVVLSLFFWSNRSDSDLRRSTLCSFSKSCLKLAQMIWVHFNYGIISDERIWQVEKLGWWVSGKG